MPKRTGDFDAWLLNELTDPRIAASYVNAAICEDPDLLPVVLREVAKAYTMKKVAKDAGVARESLYTILSECGNPTLTNLTAVLKAVRLKIAVVPDSEQSSAQETSPELSVPDQFRIDSSPRKVIDELTRAANIRATIPDIMRFFAVEPKSGIGYFSFKTQVGLGVHPCEPPALGTISSRVGSVSEEEFQDRSRVADNGRMAFSSVETYVGQLACPAGIGSQQPAP